MGRSARYAFDAVKRAEFARNATFVEGGYRAHLPEESASPNDATAEEILEPGAKPRGVMSQLPAPMSAADAAA